MYIYVYMYIYHNNWTETGKLFPAWVAGSIALTRGHQHGSQRIFSTYLLIMWSVNRIYLTDNPKNVENIWLDGGGGAVIIGPKSTSTRDPASI